MTSKEELKQILRQLRTQGGVVVVEAKAAEFLKTVDAKTLSLMEQELLQEGVSEEELRRLCRVHLEILGEGLEQQKSELTATHPIGIFMAEHKIILQNLEELQRIVGQVETAKRFGDIYDQLERLRVIADLLLDTESHHKREEEILFPRLEEHGVTGPPRIMRLEHEDLRDKKRRLAELVKEAGGLGYEEFSKRLREIGGYITSALKDHIFKEDNILYPTALQTLDTEEWGKVREEFGRIGYCSFTPLRV